MPRLTVSTLRIDVSRRRSSLCARLLRSAARAQERAAARVPRRRRRRRHARTRRRERCRPMREHAVRPGRSPAHRERTRRDRVPGRHGDRSRARTRESNAISPTRVRLLAGTMDHLAARDGRRRSAVGRATCRPICRRVRQHLRSVRLLAVRRAVRLRLVSDRRGRTGGRTTTATGRRCRRTAGRGSASTRWAWPTHHYGRWGYARNRWFWIPGRTWGAGVGLVGVGARLRELVPARIRQPAGLRAVDRVSATRWTGWTVLPRAHFGAHRLLREPLRRRRRDGCRATRRSSRTTAADRCAHRTRARRQRAERRRRPCRGGSRRRRRGRSRQSAVVGGDSGRRARDRAAAVRVVSSQRPAGRRSRDRVRQPRSTDAVDASAHRPARRRRRSASPPAPDGVSRRRHRRAASRVSDRRRRAPRRRAAPIRTPRRSRRQRPPVVGAAVTDPAVPSTGAWRAVPTRSPSGGVRVRARRAAGERAGAATAGSAGADPTAPAPQARSAAPPPAPTPARADRACRGSAPRGHGDGRGPARQGRAGAATRRPR